jgi:hypothetical protein
VQRFARKWAPFVGWLIVVVSVRALLNRHHFDLQHDRPSAWMLFVASVVIGISVLIMLADTAQWSVRRLGVFGLVVFGGLLYGLSASVALWHWTVLSQHDFNWIRALILVSSPMLFVSQIRYLAARVGQWRERRNSQ